MVEQKEIILLITDSLVHCTDHLADITEMYIDLLYIIQFMWI